jgi:hypothetical protein
MAARVGEAQASPEDLPNLRASLTALGALLPQLLPTTDSERALCRAAEPYIWIPASSVPVRLSQSVEFRQNAPQCPPYPRQVPSSL